MGSPDERNESSNAAKRRSPPVIKRHDTEYVEANGPDDTLEYGPDGSFQGEFINIVDLSPEEAKARRKEEAAQREKQQKWAHQREAETHEVPQISPKMMADLLERFYECVLREAARRTQEETAAALLERDALIKRLMSMTQDSRESFFPKKISFSDPVVSDEGSVVLFLKDIHALRSQEMSSEMKTQKEEKAWTNLVDRYRSNHPGMIEESSLDALSKNVKNMLQNQPDDNQHFSAGFQ